MLEHIIRLYPGFDKRPKKEGDPNYGICGAVLLFVVKGSRGAVDLEFFTAWYPKHVQYEFFCRERSSLFQVYPWATRFGYHSPTCRGHGGDDKPTEGCEFVAGGRCYSWCYFSAADGWENELLERGEEPIWSELERRYREEFGEEEDAGTR